MKILITAGNTQVPIDRVRSITNIFTGRTGAAIGVEAHRRGHQVTLLTSHPEAVQASGAATFSPDERWQLLCYRTFDELRSLMERDLTSHDLDAVIHSAAVSDYLAAGIYASAAGTSFQAETGSWLAQAGAPALVDRQAGKVKSDEAELWLRLVRAPKLVDLIRTEWNFRGLLVKFKLEVGISDDELLRIAERSRLHSTADLLVANTLEGAAAYAYLGAGSYRRVARGELAARLLETVEQLHEERLHG